MIATIHNIRKLVIALCLILSLQAYAQDLKYRFRQIGHTEGLSQSNVTSIVQDHRGYMWFGTRDGLNMYDGHQIVVYRNDPADPCSLPHNYIRAVYEDNKHRLWIGTDDGLSLYNRAGDDFINYRHDPRNPAGLSAGSVRAIIQDKLGRLWVGTGGGGLNLFNTEQETFTVYRHKPDGPHSISDDHIEDLAVDSTGTLWIATWNAGLNRLIPGQQRFERFRALPGTPGALSSAKLRKLYIDRTNTLWVGTTEGGLNRYEAATGTFIHYGTTQRNKLNNDDVLAIAEDREGNLWIGTQNGGINILDRNRQKITYVNSNTNSPEGLRNGSIYSLYRDRQGDMWIGTFSGGVHYYNGKRPRFRQLLQPDSGNTALTRNVLAVSEDDNGNIYTGTDGAGLIIYHRATGRSITLQHRPDKRNGIPSNYPLCLYQDRAHRMWMGSFYGKAAVLRSYGRQIDKMIFPPEIQHVATIGEDTLTGKIWMGTWGQGVLVYDPPTATWKQYLPDATREGSISHSIIFCIYQDHEGTLWIGTEGGGLSRYNRETDNFTHFGYTSAQPGGISNNIVNVVHEDAKGNLWIGTQAGLNRFDRTTNTFTAYTSSDRQRSNAIQSIEEDDHGYLWLGTNEGIARFDPGTQTFRYYEAVYGDTHNSYNRLASYRNHKGLMYFGGMQGLTSFHPDSLADSAFQPPVYFTGLQIFNKTVDFREAGSILSQPVAESRMITLSYRHSVFSLAFVALDYVAPDKNLYAYKLEGFDDDWNEVGNQRKASYTNLDPGTYTLRVKATNSDGIWSTREAAIRIVIRPPLWLTWWAKTIYILLFMAVLVAFRLIAMQRMRIRNQLEADRIKLRFYANISHELRTPLTLMLGPVSQLMASSEKNPHDRQLLQLVQKGSQHLLKLINQLMHIYKLDAGFMQLEVMRGDMTAFIRQIKDLFQYTALRRNIRYELDTLPPDTDQYFDPDKLEKIIINLLANAFNHTPDHGSITIALTWCDAAASDVPVVVLRGRKHIGIFARIAITDTGGGIPEAFHEKIFDPFFRLPEGQRSTEGTGLGLPLARQLARLHRGEILVEDIPDKVGSRFSVWLPIEAGAFRTEEHAKTPGAQTGITTAPFALWNDTLEQPVSNEGAEDSTLPLLLVVEDNNDIRHLIRLHFSTTFRVEEACHGEEGLRKAGVLLPDIILSDVMMPVLDGITMCSRLKHDICTSHIPVVLLTARGDDDIQINAFNDAHADDYIVKPFRPDVLLAKLRNILAHRENLRRKYYHEFITNPSAPALASPDDAFLHQAVQTVERYLDDPDFNIERFCRELGMSQTNLYRKLQSLLGISGHQFIQDIRMKHAGLLLANNQLTVHEIAMRVGFADAKYFSKAFRKYYGALPSAYRNTHQHIHTLTNPA